MKPKNRRIQDCGPNKGLSPPKAASSSKRSREQDGEPSIISRSPPIRQEELEPQNEAIASNIKSAQGEEDDILLNSGDEYNQAQPAELPDNKRNPVKGLFSRQKNEKSLSLHDPHIGGEIMRKLQAQNSHNLSPDGRIHQQKKTIPSMRKQNLFMTSAGMTQLLQSKPSQKSRRDRSFNSLNPFHSNIGQLESASQSQQSEIPSQKMQDYETKPLKRQSHTPINFKKHSRNSECNRLLWKNRNIIGNTYKQQFDTDNGGKRKKNFSIYTMLNKQQDSNVLLQDLSKDSADTGQNVVNMTPSKKQIDEICPQMDGTNKSSSRPSLSRPSLVRGSSIPNRSSTLLPPKPGDSQVLHSQSLFESPGNRTNKQRSGSNVMKRSTLTSKKPGSGNQSVPSNQLNPLESPDPRGTNLQQKAGMMIRTQFQTDAGDQPLQLRNNRINEIINENSEFESQHNNAQEHMESPSYLGFVNQNQPMSARTPALHPREYPLLYRSNSINKICDIQRKSFDIISKHHFNSCYGKNAENEEIRFLRKQLREQNAEFVKQKAVLEQQVQLLTQQLSIESERCKNLKKNYTAALQAFRQKKNGSPDSSPQRQARNKNNHLSQSPTRIFRESASFNGLEHLDMLARNQNNNTLNRNRSLVLNSFQYKPDPWSAKKIDILQKDNKDLQMTIKRLEELIQTTKEQSKTQGDLMYQKEQDIVQLRGNIIDYERKLKSNAESKIKAVSTIENKQTQRLQQELKNMQADQDRKISQGVEEYQARNVLLNDQIIDYQTQIKQQNNEINTHMTRLNMKEQSFRALEQQVHIYENQIQNQARDHSKIVDEYEIKVMQLEKELQKLQNVLRQLREQCEKDEIQQKKIPKKFSALINSSIDYLYCQSNNITDNAPPEETVKFISSANNSTNQFETSIHQDRESHLNGQRNILTTDALINTTTIPVDRILSDLCKSNLEIQTCIAQVHIMSKQKGQKCTYIDVRNLDLVDQNQIDHELDVLRDDDDQSIELKDRNGIGISPIVRGPKARHTFNSTTHQEIVNRAKNDQNSSMQNDLKLKRHSSKAHNQASGSQREGTPPYQDLKPLKLSSYWAQDDNFKDDGSCSLENVNGLRRLIASMRNRKNKLVVKFNNLKSDSIKEIKRLERKVAVLQSQIKEEKDKRVDVQMRKLEQSSALYETINDKASKINRLKQQLYEIESEKDDLQSLGQSYPAFGTRLSEDRDDGLRSMYNTARHEIEPSVYQSQQLYNLKGLQRGSQRYSVRSASAKGNSVNASMSLKNVNQIKFEGYNKQMMGEKEYGKGANTSRKAGAEDKKRTLSRYMTERPRLDITEEFNPLSGDVQSPRDQQIGNEMLKKFSTLQAVQLQEQSIQQQHELGSDKESGHNLMSNRSPRGIQVDKAYALQKSPRGFIQQSHLLPAKTLTLKSLDSQRLNKIKNKKLKQSASNIFSNSEVSLISNLNKANKPILAPKQNVVVDDDDNNIVQCGCAPQNILMCKSPLQPRNQYEQKPQQNNYQVMKMKEDYGQSLTDRNMLISPTMTRDYDTNSNHQAQLQVEILETNGGVPDDTGCDSQVNMMSPTAKRGSFMSAAVRQSMKKLAHGIPPQVPVKVEQISNDSEDELDVGQETQSGNHDMVIKQGAQIGQSNSKEQVPPLNLQFASTPSKSHGKMNSTTHKTGQKGMFYGDSNKSKINKMQSPIANYKRFLTNQSDVKSPVQNPQIIKRPIIQSYLTQNLPSKNDSRSGRREKNSLEITKKTLSMKSLTSQSGFKTNLSNQNQQNAEDRMVYTARTGSKAFGSPRYTVDHSQRNQGPNLIPETKQKSHYKASSYLSSQKMTPNMQSIDQSSISHPQSLTAQRQSQTHFVGQRTLSSFFSHPSQIGLAPITPTNNIPPSTPQTTKKEEMKQMRSTDNTPKLNAGRMSKQSNMSHDSNSHSNNQVASRQSTAQQMYQAYKNKYLNKNQ